MGGRKSKKKGTYDPEPDVPVELRERYATVLEAMSGLISVSKGAKRLEMSRNHFQSLMHRAMSGCIEGITPQPAGRPARSDREKELQKQKTRLEREVARLRDQAEVTQRALGVMQQVLRGEVQVGRTRRRSRRGGHGADDENDETGLRLEVVRGMREQSIPSECIALFVGVSGRTLRRHMDRARAGKVVVEKRGPGPNGPPDGQVVMGVEGLVRESKGLFGAASLSKSIEGVSRREAGGIKKRTVRQMERERKSQARMVRVAAPGVMRGFDQIFLRSEEGREVVLVSSDACVPFRTGFVHATHYDAASVAEALELDYARHGAPLVQRLDNYSSHKAADVREVFESYGVLPLHGPPRYPCYYGQTEHMNGEHREWLDALGALSHDAIAPAFSKMLEVLNFKWRRRTLGWKTAAEAWEMRPELNIDREDLRAEVLGRAERIRSRLEERDDADQLSWRLAVEQALRTRGLLTVVTGGWC